MKLNAVAISAPPMTAEKIDLDQPAAALHLLDIGGDEPNRQQVEQRFQNAAMHKTISDQLPHVAVNNRLGSQGEQSKDQIAQRTIHRAQQQQNERRRPG